ncbi:MAG: 4Fe-4S binding protein [Actinobacteria bacterium]|nr:4Fe-4S binding protein [Actinomycetota bacterium]
MLRKIVHIDEEKCDGCGLCAEACAEGAIAIIDGKARLVSESYCDGLGACLGECPRGAITILEREAAPFDEEAVLRHLGKDLGDGGRSPEIPVGSAPGEGHELEGSENVASLPRGQRAGGAHLPCGCPGTAVRELQPPAEKAEVTTGGGRGNASLLRNWPIQLRLVPVNAPYLRGARLLVAADCTAFAFPGFNPRLLEERVLLVGCPKLDDASFYREKLAGLIAENQVREITVAHMEVPCCFGLANIARQAIEDTGADIKLTVVKLGVNGDLLSMEKVELLSGRGPAH